MIRTILYVLLPVSIVAALLFCCMGVIQNFDAYTVATTARGKTQTIAQGPVASQEAIKMLGTNGGGIFNANSAHPFEIHSMSNMLQMLLIFIIHRGLTYMFGEDGWRYRARDGGVRDNDIAVSGWRFVHYGSEQAGKPHAHKIWS